jgi:hypothetical protein
VGDLVGATEDGASVGATVVALVGANVGVVVGASVGIQLYGSSGSVT